MKSRMPRLKSSTTESFSLKLVVMTQEGPGVAFHDFSGGREPVFKGHVVIQKTDVDRDLPKLFDELIAVFYQIHYFKTEPFENLTEEFTGRKFIVSHQDTDWFSLHVQAQTAGVDFLGIH
jgi:hypothetical protein